MDKRILYYVTKVNKDFDAGRLTKHRVDRLTKYKEAIYRGVTSYPR